MKLQGRAKRSLHHPRKLLGVRQGATAGTPTSFAEVACTQEERGDSASLGTGEGAACEVEIYATRKADAGEPERSR